MVLSGCRDGTPMQDAEGLPSYPDIVNGSELIMTGQRPVDKPAPAPSRAPAPKREKDSDNVRKMGAIFDAGAFELATPSATLPPRARPVSLNNTQGSPVGLSSWAWR